MAEKDAVPQEPPWKAQENTLGETVSFGNMASLPGPGANSADRPPSPILPDFEVLAELGEGGMGIVYKARQLSLKRLVAIKMISAGAHALPRMMARFQQEAEAVARLQHPNIVQIFAIVQHQGCSFLALEFVDGGSLDKALAHQPQPGRTAAQVVETLARAIHHAHERGIVHRDLKPANVLLALGDCRTQDAASDNWQSATPKITDFGLAKQLDSDTGQTQTGVILGTPSYMAPEQAEGNPHNVGPAADVYALGAILYEMLTGRPPFRGTTPMWSTPRGKDWARRIAFQEISLQETLRVAAVLLITEWAKQGAIGDKVSPAQDELVWKSFEEVQAAFEKGQFTTDHLLPLALTWKGVSGAFGWAGVEARLAPNLRGPFAYIFGHRYLRLNRPDDARRFFQTARDQAQPSQNLLRRLAEEELQRLPTAIKKKND